MQRFERVQLGRAFTEARFELGRALLGFFDRRARQVVTHALVVRQHDRPHLDVEIVQLLAVEDVLDLARDRDRHRRAGRDRNRRHTRCEPGGRWPRRARRINARGERQFPGARDQVDAVALRQRHNTSFMVVFSIQISRW